ncbi:MAG: hypothetical protein ACREL9_01485 [Gemmatimonadales bacterium]
MSEPVGRPPLRVEQALRLLPDVEALAPLRAFLISTSRPEQRDAWAPSQPYRTVGKRYLQPGELRRQVPEALSRVTAHLSALYQAVVEALEGEQRGDLGAAVRALLTAGEREQSVGRFGQARAWFDHALARSEELRDRRPEIETLRALGYLDLAVGRYEDGARRFQRSLVLAEAELDQEGIVLACLGLGHVARAQGAWIGAEAWYTRGLQLGAGDQLRTAQLQHRLGDVARRRGDLRTAGARLRQALDVFRSLDRFEEVARVLNSQGQLEVDEGRPAEALAAYRDALTALRRGAGDPSLEMTTRVNIATLQLETDHWLEGEDEIRRGEELAIAHNLTRQLAQLYVLLGRLRGRQGDEDGFVFFEKAIELCRGLEASPRLEGEIYHAYGAFRARLGEREEARVYLDRAKQIYESLGDAFERRRVGAALEQLPPA